MADLVWNGEAVAAEARRLAGERVKAAGELLADTARELVSRSQPVRGGRGLAPSAPGEPPKQVTGGLKASIHADYDAATQTSTVGTDLPQGRMLELGTATMAPRPWLVPALVKAAPAMKRILESPAGGDGG